ncbi:MAG: Hg(II)-responsive transcriptional regulator [Chloroflexi bacterium]|nr:Hg(II)-responsive transcriptional regulator [Chloroflexota bacterium]
MRYLTIGQLAKTAQVKVETVRYYERRGLIPEPPRSDSGYRQYSRDVATRIKFIKRAQELGFSLKEISGLLCLKAGPDADCADVKNRAQAKLNDIEAKIRDLERMKEVLSELVAMCVGSGPTKECPILRALVTAR